LGPFSKHRLILVQFPIMIQTMHSDLKSPS
jgi:hypothetical protein